MKEVDRALLERAETGFAGEHASELIQELVLAMKHGIGLKRIASTIYGYPTFASLVLKERLSIAQLCGVVFAIGAAVMLGVS